MTSLMRSLSLHASALSDTEYDVYTSSLTDIADEPTSDDDVVHDDAHYEQMSVGVREVRAWLRGRYSHIPASTIDSILKYFSPNLGQGDALTGGQFFAALRLVVHVDNGKEVDRSLAFVQADLASKNSKSGPPPPPPLRRHLNRTNKSVSLSLTPTVTQLSLASSSTTVNNSFPTTSTPDANPSSSSPMPQAPPQHPMLRVDPIQTTSSSSHNPFSKGNSTQKHDEPSSNKSPPLPPRKPPPPIPSQLTRHAAPPIPAKRATSPMRQATGAGALFPSHGASHLLGNPAPPSLALKPVSHVTSTLIKQSLHASKVAQSLKKAEEQLEKERIMQVLKSSSGGSATARNRSVSPVKSVGCNAVTTASSSSSSRSGGSDDRDRMAPPLPKRRDQPRPSRFNHSPPRSITSYEQIALSGLGLRREPSTSSRTDALNDAAPSSHGDMERGRTHGHSKARSVSSFPHDLDSNPGSVAASTTSSPSRMSAGLPAIPPPTHPDLRERNEKDKGIRRYSSLSVHSGKSGKSAGLSLNRLNALSQPVQNTVLHKGQTPNSGPVDTRSFDSVYGSLVSPVDTGNDGPSTPTTATPSLYATPSSEIAHLPPVQTNLSSPLSTSLDLLTPTTSNPSPTTRVFRSRSLLQPSTPPPIPPPPRRKRPESVQVVTTSTNGNGGSTLFQELVNKFEENTEGEGSKKLLRHLSLSGSGFSSGSLNSTSNRTFSTAHNDNQEDSKSSTTRRSSMSAPSAPGGSTNPLSHSQHRTQSLDSSSVDEEPLSLAALQRTFASLQPKLDKARYKAEAGISRRGFIQGDGFGGNGTRGSEDGGEREGLVRHSWSRLERSGSESSTGDEAEYLREVNGSLERDEQAWTGATKIW
ncbi:hypothetical protein M378DRAFT_197506 [Amanita muscaria Koide BX008]|uniref:Uncharacterized protein n=1 Tax=Amanita muscaria (strain Koide BX008) TaxID=946122 RepID=A0A0C2WXC2_AMAMK|nr:hypothetical protein M378DRAFT_197506 [Amanita muscaria Koide BX008]